MFILSVTYIVSGFQEKIKTVWISTPGSTRIRSFSYKFESAISLPANVFFFSLVRIFYLKLPAPYLYLTSQIVCSAIKDCTQFVSSIFRVGHRCDPDAPTRALSMLRGTLGMSQYSTTAELHDILLAINHILETSNIRKWVTLTDSPLKSLMVFGKSCNNITIQRNVGEMVKSLNYDIK